MPPIRKTVPTAAQRLIPNVSEKGFHNLPKTDLCSVPTTYLPFLNKSHLAPASQGGYNGTWIRKNCCGIFGSTAFENVKFPAESKLFVAIRVQLLRGEAMLVEVR